MGTREICQLMAFRLASMMKFDKKTIHFGIVKTIHFGIIKTKINLVLLYKVY